MKRIKSICLLTILLISYRGFSQDVPKGFELMELMKIAETYRLLPDLSFNMVYTYADSAHPNNILEELTGSYKIHNGKYWGSIDSAEFVQGNQYSVGVYYSDSIIAVKQKEEYSNVMQLPMMDSLFREANIESMDVVKLNDSTRSLTIKFTALAPYRGYEIQYDLNNFLIRKIKYFLADTDMSEEGQGSGVVCVTIAFTNYSMQLISEEYFDEAKFVYRQSDQFYAQPAYSGFKVLVSGNGQQ